MRYFFGEYMTASLVSISSTPCTTVNGQMRRRTLSKYKIAFELY